MLAWVGWVLWRYQIVEPALPFGHLALAGVWLGILTLACLGLGHAVWTGLRQPERHDLASLVLRLASGAGVLIALAGVLAAAGVLSTAPLLAVLCVAAAAGIWLVLSGRSGAAGGATSGAEEGARLPLAAAAAAVVLTALTLPAPSPFYDQLHYHLAFPQRWLEAGTVLTWDRHSYSFLPANMGLLYTYALAALGPWAAQAAHWWCGLVAGAGVWALARRLGGGAGSWWAVALFATTPSVMLMSTWAIADLGVVLFGVAAVLAVVPAATGGRGRPELARTALSGALAGLAVGCKYPALGTVAAPVAVVLLVMAWPRGWRRAVACLAIWCAGLGLTLSPWLARNAAVTGDPIYPYGAAALASLSDGSPRNREVLQRAEGIGALDRGGWSTDAVLSLGTFDPRGAAGNIGPVYLALAPLTLWFLARRRSRPMTALATGVGLGVVLWGFMPHLGRYMVPLLAPAASLGGLALAEAVDRWRKPLRHWFLVLVALVLVWNLHAGVSGLTFDRAAASLGRRSVDAYMGRYVTYWDALPFLNRHLPPDSKVLLVGESRTLYMECDVLFEDPFQTPLLVELAGRSSSSREVAASLSSRGVTHLLFNRQEAARMAVLNGRERYLQAPDSAAAARLEQFLRDCLRPLYDEGPVSIYALEECGS